MILKYENLFRLHKEYSFRYYYFLLTFGRNMHERFLSHYRYLLNAFQYVPLFYFLYQLYVTNSKRLVFLVSLDISPSKLSPYPHNLIPFLFSGFFSDYTIIHLNNVIQYKLLHYKKI